MYYTVDYFYNLNLKFDIQSGFFEKEDEQGWDLFNWFSNTNLIFNIKCLWCLSSKFLMRLTQLNLQTINATPRLIFNHSTTRDFIKLWQNKKSQIFVVMLDFYLSFFEFEYAACIKKRYSKTGRHNKRLCLLIL